MKYVSAAFATLALVIGVSSYAQAQDNNSRQTFRERLRERILERGNARRAEIGKKQSGEKTTLGGREVNIWAPSATGPAPLILFSHGFGGCPTQSTFLTEALAQSGYLVVAVKHADTNCTDGPRNKPAQGFREPDVWSDASYRDRHDDMLAVLDALRSDVVWKDRIDWTHIGLMGHSLGGYTVLGLGGGWPSWKISGVKAILALSPYCAPFLNNGDLAHLSAPVSYQGGTRDIGITPSVKKPGGCYDTSAAPKHFVEFDGVGHFGWTDAKPDTFDEIIHYTRAFFDANLRGQSDAPLHEKQAGVSEIKWK